MLKVPSTVGMIWRFCRLLISSPLNVDQRNFRENSCSKIQVLFHYQNFWSSQVAIVEQHELSSVANQDTFLKAICHWCNISAVHVRLWATTAPIDGMPAVLSRKLHYSDLVVFFSLLICVHLRWYSPKGNTTGWIKAWARMMILNNYGWRCRYQ
jgi:hypothetical protein